MTRFIVVLMLFCVACSPAPQKTSEDLARSDLIVTDIANAPPEYQLAYLDQNQLPRGDDVHSARIRYLLKMVSEKTGEPQKQIADRTSRSTTLLKQDYGRAVSNEQFLENAKAYYDAGGPKTSYNDLSTLLLMQLAK